MAAPKYKIVFKTPEGAQKTVGAIWENDGQNGKYLAFNPTTEENEYDMDMEDAIRLYKAQEGRFFVNEPKSKDSGGRGGARGGAPQRSAAARAAAARTAARRPAEEAGGEDAENDPANCKDCPF